MDLLGNRTLNIAHRGARSLAPENTLAAARKGLALGADAWELDVAMTADDELVVLHDGTLGRTSNAAEVFPGREPWRVADFSLAELRRLDFGSWFAASDPFGQIAAGQVSSGELEAYRGEPIPTLREALAWTAGAGWQVNVEVKDLSGTSGDASVVERVAGMVQELGMQDAVLISSFNHSYLRRCKAAAPGIRIGALVEPVEPGGLVSPPASVKAIAALLQDLQAQAYHPNAANLDLRHIAPLRQRGFAVLVWTVNEAEEMQRLAAAGAGGVFTDFPQRFGRAYHP